MSRLDKDRELKLQPLRMEHAISELTKIGIEIIYRDTTKIKFLHNGVTVTLFPYSGWHSGVTIKDGRGIEKLLNQLDQKK